MFIRNGELAIIFRLKHWLSWLKSLQFWLFLSFLTLSMLPVLAYRGTLVEEFRKSQIQELVKQIQSQSKRLGNQLVTSKYVEDPSNVVLNTLIENIASVYNGRAMIVDSNFSIIKDTYIMGEKKLNISEDVLATFRGNTNERNKVYDGYVEFIIPLYRDTLKEKQVEAVMILTVSTQSMDMFIAEVLKKTQLLELVAFLFLLVVSFVLSKVLTNPFQDLIQNLNHIADDNMGEDMIVNTFTETSEISDSISQALGRLRNIDESRQEFVSNVSHELKTPITSIRVLADSLMAQEDAPVELYREFMADISEEIDRESKIIDDLLTLVKLDKSATELSVTPVAVNELLKLILKRLRPLANLRNIELVLESVRPVTVEVDEVKLTLALSNLVENAIKYNIVDGWVRITLDADHKFCYVKVADSGIGIPEEFQSNIFERFYRVDKARSREKGGTGLGLSIARNIILLHHGAIKVSSKENEGTTFTVRIPLTYIA